MNRLYSLLSFILLSLVGITSAVAQQYDRGERLTTVDQVVGQSVLLYSEGRYGNGYLQGTVGFASEVSDDCVWTIQAVSGVTVDGNQVYVLKQNSTGKYLKDYTLPDGKEDSSDAPPSDAVSGAYTALTSDVSEAYQFTVLPAQTSNADSRRDYATEGNNSEQNLSDVCFVMARKDLISWTNGDQVEYFNHFSNPMFAIYNDTNAWQIYSTVERTGLSLLEAYHQYYFGTSGTPSALYPAGTAPGQYKKELVDAAQAVYEESNAQLNNYTLTDAELQDLIARIKAAMEALQADDARYGLEPGAYYIYTQAGRYLYASTFNNQDFVYASNTTYKPSEPMATNDVAKVWYLTKDADGQMQLQNAQTQGYMTGKFAAHSGSDDGYGYTLSSSPASAGDFSIEIVDGGFNIVSKATSPGNGQHVYHSKFNDGVVMAWNNAVENNTLSFASVDVAGIDELIKQAKQDALNEKLTTLYGTAKQVYDEAHVTTVEAEAEGVSNEDELFTDIPDALVSATGDESTSHWWSNAKSSQEGEYESLLDGDFSTYFHSDWTSGFTPSDVKNHYLVATLDQPVTAPGLVLKMAKRATGNDYPTKLHFYGSNDFDSSNADAATWTDLGSCEIAWNLGDGFASQGVGTAAAAIADGASYKYIKVAAIGTIFNEKNPMTNRGYFAISECNIWQAATCTATTTPTAEAQQVPEAIAKAFEDQLAASKDAIAAGTATDALYNALAEALENYENNYPRPERVTEACTAAQTFLTSVSSLIGEGQIGLYSQTAADALQAVIDKYAEFSEVTLDAINAAVTEINASLAAFKGSVVLPEPGYYTISCATYEVAGSNDGGSGTLHNAIVYAPNSLADGNNEIYKFIRAVGSADITEVDTAAMNSLEPGISAEEDARVIFQIVSASNGQLVVRNVANGLYFAAANGKVYQSVEETAINVEGLEEGVFVINAGQNASGTTVYANFKVANTTITTWNSRSDKNAKFKFDAAEPSDLFYGLPATEGQYAIVTLPVSIDPSESDINAYSVAGVTEDGSKLVLALIEDQIPAGTPFIAIPNEGAVTDNGTVSVFMSDNTDDGVNYEYTPQPATGLVGTITSTVTVPEYYGYLNGGVVTATNETKIGANSGYFDYAKQTVVEYDESDDTQAALALNDVVIDAISAAKVAVLPSVVNVYNINGQLVRKNVKAANSTKGLPAGLYIVGGMKTIVK